MSGLNLFKIEKKKTIGRRNDRIASQIREVFSTALARGDFPSLPNHEKESMPPDFITITYVDLSPDLKNAKVFVSSLKEEKKDETLKFFSLQSHFFKDLIAKKMRLKFIPNLSFKLDGSIEYSERIEELLQNDAPKR
ncbi:MAG: 30S ribosome-binding factor RbfA [Holosporales bacterium]|jgi:ribosome-binding factor A|nr:30S ribosome-binding factor RbfA [Holosporales bacterium]